MEAEHNYRESGIQLDFYRCTDLIANTMIEEVSADYAINTDGDAHQRSHVNWPDYFDALDKGSKPTSTYLKQLIGDVGGEIRSRRIEHDKPGSGVFVVSVCSRTPEVYGVAWELAYLADDAELLGSPGSVLVHYYYKTTRVRRVRAIRARSSARVLLAWSNGANNENKVEGAEHAKVIGRSKNLHSETLENASFGSLTAHLSASKNSGKPFDILHIVCHGEKDSLWLTRTDDNAETTDSSGDERVDATALETKLGQYASTLKLVVISACGTDETPRSFLISGIAERLHRMGIPVVIAFRFALKVKDSINFAETLYERLALGETIESSFLAAQDRIYDREFATYRWAGVQIFCHPRVLGERIIVTKLERVPWRPILLTALLIAIVTLSVFFAVCGANEPEEKVVYAQRARRVVLIGSGTVYGFLCRNTPELFSCAPSLDSTTRSSSANTCPSLLGALGADCGFIRRFFDTLRTFVTNNDFETMFIDSGSLTGIRATASYLYSGDTGGTRFEDPAVVAAASFDLVALSERAPDKLGPFTDGLTFVEVRLKHHDPLLSVLCGHDCEVSKELGKETWSCDALPKPWHFKLGAVTPYFENAGLIDLLIKRSAGAVDYWAPSKGSATAMSLERRWVSAIDSHGWNLSFIGPTHKVCRLKEGGTGWFWAGEGSQFRDDLHKVREDDACSPRTTGQFTKGRCLIAQQYESSERLDNMRPLNLYLRGKRRNDDKEVVFSPAVCKIVTSLLERLERRAKSDVASITEDFDCWSAPDVEHDGDTVTRSKLLRGAVGEYAMPDRVRCTDKRDLEALQKDYRRQRRAFHIEGGDGPKACIFKQGKRWENKTLPSESSGEAVNIYRLRRDYEQWEPTGQTGVAGDKRVIELTRHGGLRTSRGEKAIWITEKRHEGLRATAGWEAVDDELLKKIVTVPHPSGHKRNRLYPWERRDFAVKVGRTESPKCEWLKSSRSWKGLYAAFSPDEGCPEGEKPTETQKFYTISGTKVEVTREEEEERDGVRHHRSNVRYLDVNWPALSEDLEISGMFATASNVYFAPEGRPSVDEDTRTAEPSEWQLGTACSSYNLYSLPVSSVRNQILGDTTRVPLEPQVVSVSHGDKMRGLAPREVCSEPQSAEQMNSAFNWKWSENSDLLFEFAGVEAIEIDAAPVSSEDGVKIFKGWALISINILSKKDRETETDHEIARLDSVVLPVTLTECVGNRAFCSEIKLDWASAEWWKNPGVKINTGTRTFGYAVEKLSAEALILEKSRPTLYPEMNAGMNIKDGIKSYLYKPESELGFVLGKAGAVTLPGNVERLSSRRVKRVIDPLHGRVTDAFTGHGQQPWLVHYLWRSEKWRDHVNVKDDSIFRARDQQALEQLIRLKDIDGEVDCVIDIAPVGTGRQWSGATALPTARPTAPPEKEYILLVTDRYPETRLGFVEDLCGLSTTPEASVPATPTAPAAPGSSPP